MSNISPTKLQSVIPKCTFFLDFLFFRKQVTLIIQAYLKLTISILANGRNNTRDSRSLVPKGIALSLSF